MEVMRTLSLPLQPSCWRSTKRVAVIVDFCLSLICVSISGEGLKLPLAACPIWHLRTLPCRVLISVSDVCRYRQSHLVRAWHQEKRKPQRIQDLGNPPSLPLQGSHDRKLGPRASRFHNRRLWICLWRTTSNMGSKGPRKGTKNQKTVTLGQRAMNMHLHERPSSPRKIRARATVVTKLAHTVLTTVPQK